MLTHVFDPLGVCALAFSRDRAADQVAAGLRMLMSSLSR